MGHKQSVLFAIFTQVKGAHKFKVIWTILVQLQIYSVVPFNLAHPLFVEEFQFQLKHVD